MALMGSRASLSNIQHIWTYPVAALILEQSQRARTGVRRLEAGQYIVVLEFTPYWWRIRSAGLVNESVAPAKWQP